MPKDNIISGEENVFMENIYIRVGAKIRGVRKRHKMTLEDLSAKVGLDWSFVARIETGKAIPSIMSLLRISKALNMSMEELFAVKKVIPKEDDLLERELLSIFRALKVADKSRIIHIIKIVLSIPIKTST